MRNQTHINVTITIPNQQIEEDMRIPIQISVRQFIKEIEELLRVNILGRKVYRLKVSTKSLFLSDEDRLEDFPIGNGDIIEIIRGEEE